MSYPIVFRLLKSYNWKGWLAMFILLGIIGLVAYMMHTQDKVERRKQSMDEIKRQQAEYNTLLQEGREDEALAKFHSKAHTRHPSFCQCFKCSVKRTFTS